MYITNDIYILYFRFQKLISFTFFKWPFKRLTNYNLSLRLLLFAGRHICVWASQNVFLFKDYILGDEPKTD